jgi:hypothetical protein
VPYSERFGLVHVAIPKTGTTSLVHALHRLHDHHGGELTLVKEKVDRAFCHRHGLDTLPGRHPGRAKHLSALELATVLGERYREGFSFSFVRNPWARTLSRYAFCHAENRPSLLARWRRGTSRRFHREEFHDWLRRRARQAEKKGGLPSQLDKLSDADGRLIVDYVGRLESVDDGFARVCREAGVPSIKVPHHNGTGRGHRYTEVYDAWSRDLVADLYRRDIEAFGYEFEGPPANSARAIPCSPATA